ncbi:hypothetical protein BJ912DRAFT_1094067 [Pholiota molesta]|nr:hypothetical protein BJ912DRAFT_1094067 [Pholiota molesta]
MNIPPDLRNKQTSIPAVVPPAIQMHTPSRKERDLPHGGARRTRQIQPAARPENPVAERRRMIALHRADDVEAQPLQTRRMRRERGDVPPPRGGGAPNVPEEVRPERQRRDRGRRAQHRVHLRDRRGAVPRRRRRPERERVHRRQAQVAERGLERVLRFVRAPAQAGVHAEHREAGECADGRVRDGGDVLIHYAEVERARLQAAEGADEGVPDVQIQKQHAGQREVRQPRPVVRRVCEIVSAESVLLKNQTPKGWLFLGERGCQVMGAVDELIVIPLPRIRCKYDGMGIRVYSDRVSFFGSFADKVRIESSDTDILRRGHELQEEITGGCRQTTTSVKTPSWYILTRPRLDLEIRSRHAQVLPPPSQPSQTTFEHVRVPDEGPPIPMPVDPQFEAEVRPEEGRGKYHRSPGGTHLAEEHRRDRRVRLEEDVHRRILDTAGEDFTEKLIRKIGYWALIWTVCVIHSAVERSLASSHEDIRCTMNENENDRRKYAVQKRAKITGPGGQPCAREVTECAARQHGICRYWTDWLALSSGSHLIFQDQSQ